MLFCFSPSVSGALSSPFFFWPLRPPIEVPRRANHPGQQIMSADTSATSADVRGPSRTSLTVFRYHLRWSTPDSEGHRVCDAREIISRVCYLDWLSSRGLHPPSKPEKTFQRILCDLTPGESQLKKH